MKLVLGFGSVVMTLLLGGCMTGRIEEPKYEVVARHGEMEVRAYAPRILAQTVVEGDFERAPNEGFRRIAKFIFGDNVPQKKVAMTAPVEVIPNSESTGKVKISMTAPVTQQSSAAGMWTITFTMPANYTMETLPKPVDSKVFLRQLAPMKYAALRFGGFNTRENVDDAIMRLREMAAAQSIKLKGEPVYARYNPPWTPWFWRRNEILIEVADGALGQNQ
jgi:hypothetical protein